MKSIDIEAVIIKHLNDSSVYPAYEEVPGNSKEVGEFITVERVGGGRSSVVIDKPMIAIQAWAQSKRRARQMAYEVDDLMPSMNQVDGVGGIERNSMVNFPDEKGNPRYQLIFNISTIS